MDAKNWTLNTYTVATWTDLVAATAPTVVNTLTIATGSTAGNVQIRIADSSGASKAIIVPSSTLIPMTGFTPAVGVLTLGTGDKLQIQASVAGMQFGAFGAA